jgi:hypothetical protein
VKTCSGTRHVWHVTSDGDRLNTADLRPGRKCYCGLRVIARIPCSEGCSHRRVLSHAAYEKLMEDK